MKTAQGTQRPRQPRGGPVVVRGVQYESRKAAASALGVSHQRVTQILHEQELRKSGRQPKRGRPGKSVTIGGMTYPSITAAARILGVNQLTIAKWQKRPPSQRHIRTIIFDLECLERRLPEPFRPAVVAARRILLEQADILDQSWSWTVPR